MHCLGYLWLEQAKLDWLLAPFYFNPSDTDTGIFRNNLASAMSTDVTTPFLARSSAPMVLNIQDKQGCLP